MIEKLQPSQELGGFLDEEGTFWETRGLYMYTKVLPSCGCGDPSALGKYVFDMLSKHANQDGWSETKYGDMPVMFFLAWADREKYIEHGTTIRCSWLTEKGKELLKDLEVVLAEASAEESKPND